MVHLDPLQGIVDVLVRHYSPPPPKPPRRWASPGAMARAIDRTTRSTPALELIDRELVRLVETDDDNLLMLFMPPQEGKSQRVSRRFPLWLLVDDPTLRIGIVSYSDGKAARWGKQIRRDIQANPQLGIKLRADSRAAGRWETEQGGGIICAGIGGGITGEPLDVLIIDDPVRGRAEAESATYREAAWDWWESNGSTRASSRFRCVVMMTRWHEADLAGMLLKHEAGDWRVVSIPAIAGKPLTIKKSDGTEKTIWVADGPDPLGRAPGEELQTVQGRKRGHFRRLHRIRSSYVWRSVFQQKPVAAEGNLFARANFRYWNPLRADPSRHGRMAGQRIDLAGQMVYLDDCWRFATIDLAGSLKTSADYTVVSAWAITPSGDLVLLDRARARVKEGDHFEMARPLIERWLLDVLYVEQSFISATIVIDATKSGIPVEPVNAEGDKVTRALPATTRVKGGRVWFPARVDWLDEWCDELAAFPSGSHDDQVDTLSYAARVVAAHWLPEAPPAHNGQTRQAVDDSAIGQAYEASTGHASGSSDYFDLPY